MSYDKKIGFFPQTSSAQLGYLQAMGVRPILHDVKKSLPEQAKEPEPKIWLPRPKSFMQVRDVISKSSNAFIIPGQFFTDKNPLVSILTDTRKNGFATAKLDALYRSLRLRFEVDPLTGAHTQYDYNEKTALGVSTIIGGLPDRVELEHAFALGVSFEQGYNDFVQQCAAMGTPSACHDIPYSEQHVYGGYIAARVAYGFALRHPVYPVAFVFEACEDMYDTYLNDMIRASHKDICEFEFEPKQVWGVLPDFAYASKEGFRHFLYSSMIQIRDHIVSRVPDSKANFLSKAENTKDHLGNHNIKGSISENNLADYYRNRVPTGYSEDLTPLQWSLSNGHSIEKTLQNAQGHIAARCGKMFHTKMRQNINYEVPPFSIVSDSRSMINLNDNYVPPQPEGLVVNGP